MIKKGEMMENYNEFCKKSKCEEYIEWEFYGKKLYSCKKMKPSKNIDRYPSDCNFIDEIKKVTHENS